MVVKTLRRFPQFENLANYTYTYIYTYTYTYIYTYTYNLLTAEFINYEF